MTWEEETPIPQGFVLSESAMYSFMDQDVYPDILSFCSAIPDHLKPLFLIPIALQTSFASDISITASRVASYKFADGAIPSGSTEDADLFGTKTFVYEDVTPTVPSSEPGSIFDIDGADEMTHHQDLEENQDKNYQVPTDTSYMSDVDVTDSGFQYPYRTEEVPRHSSILVFRFPRLALSPEDLESRAPDKVKEKASSCSVRLISYDKRGRIYTFSANCGNKPWTVRASLTDIQHIAMSCNCPSWRWNGPEFHAQANSYMLGHPHGTASPPDVRDPDRTYWLCKHAYAVLTRMDEFVSDVVDQSWDSDEEPSEAELLEAIDKNWDDLEEIAEIPLDDVEEEIEVDWEDPDSEDENDVSVLFEESPDGYGEDEEDSEPVKEEDSEEENLIEEEPEFVELEEEPEEDSEPEFVELEEEPEEEPEEDSESDESDSKVES